MSSFLSRRGFSRARTVRSKNHDRPVVAKQCAQDLGVGTKKFLPFADASSTSSDAENICANPGEPGWRAARRRPRPRILRSAATPPAATLQSCERVNAGAGCPRKGIVHPSWRLSILYQITRSASARREVPPGSEKEHLECRESLRGHKPVRPAQESRSRAPRGGSGERISVPGHDRIEPGTIVLCQPFQMIVQQASIAERAFAKDASRTRSSRLKVGVQPLAQALRAERGPVRQEPLDLDAKLPSAGP